MGKLLEDEMPAKLWKRKTRDLRNMESNPGDCDEKIQNARNAAIQRAATQIRTKE